MTTLRLYGTVTDSIVDGPGLRYAVFTQGCSHGCKGCHNPESQPFDGGYVVSLEALVSDIKANKLIRGVTLTGGEPFDQAEPILVLARMLKEAGYNLWIYSGYLYENLMAGYPHSCAPDILALCDVLVDGPFVEALNSFDLRWKGSSNQRVIDLRKTEQAGHIVLWEEEELLFEKPSSW